MVIYRYFAIKLNQMSNNLYANSNGVKQLRTTTHFNHSHVTPLVSRVQGQPRQPRPYSSFHQQSTDQRPPPRDINQIKNEAILKQACYKPEPKLQRSSSGYINSDVRKLMENNSINQETNGVFPFQSKLGEKIRQYAQYQHNENRMSLNTNNDSKVTVRSQQKNMESSMEIQKMVEFKEWVSSELIKVNERLNKNQQRITHIDKKISNNERSGCFSNQQTQELNRIISLVEKAGNREDHKRTAKMIQQMRENILELHETVNQLTIKKDSASLIQTNKDNQLERDVSTLKAQLQELIKKQSERNQISSKIKSMQDSIDELKQGWHNRERLLVTVVSTRKCEGPTFAVKIEEKATALVQNRLSKQGENNEKIIENEQRMAILSERVYYIDSEGFLLDGDRFYLLNQKQEQIKLTELELQMLRKHGLI